MQIVPQQMRAACTRGFLNATELADYLVERDIPFRQAHELVGKIVLRALELDCTLEDLPLEEYRRFSALFAPDLYETLRLETCLERRSERGGTAPGQVRRALRQFHKKIAT